MEERDYILVFINGKKYCVRNKNAFIALSDFLRYNNSLCGTKIVCAEGDCGSCTVVCGTIKNNKIDYRIINSCIKYVYQLDGKHIITVEGLKDNENLNPIQESMIKNHGAQCGFCTPGFIVGITDLYNKVSELPDINHIKNYLTGNLCRCTGYEPITKAVLDTDFNKLRKFEEIYNSDKIINEYKKVKDIPIHIKYEEKEFYSPLSIEEACIIKNNNPNIKIISGGTDLGVQFNKKFRKIEKIMSLSLINFEEIKKENNQIHVSPHITLSELEDFIKNDIPEFYKILNVFGSPQIKNSGTIIGNIANASPIADTLPFLFVTESLIELTSTKGKRLININKFYKGYKKYDLNDDEIITKVIINIPISNVKLYKVSKRKDLDISTFTAAFSYSLDNYNNITDIKIAFGGVGPVVVRLYETEKYLKGKKFDVENIVNSSNIAISEITPISDVRGSKNFRLRLAKNIFLKFFYESSEKEKVLC
jgi:xanthine dehydrogenase small subunit